VQLHHLTLNAIGQIGKFIWAITSCGGRSTAHVFVQYYELHYQNKKIHLEGAKLCSLRSLDVSHFIRVATEGGRSLPPLRNKWTSGWDGNWFYCKVPSEPMADVQGKFLACSIWPLSKTFEFGVDRKETPLSKVMVPMPNVAPIIGRQESEAAFETWIMDTTCLLVGNHYAMEHTTYMRLRHRRLNRVFELAGLLC
jgi:hypothetical protein